MATILSLGAMEMGDELLLGDRVGCVCGVMGGDVRTVQGALAQSWLCRRAMEGDGGRGLRLGVHDCGNGRFVIPA